MADVSETTNGSIVVPAGVTKIVDAKLTGPGGGGAGNVSGRTGGPGGSGMVVKSSPGVGIIVVPGETLTWVLPAGGAAGISAANGGTPPDATLTGSVSGVLLRAKPGQGGTTGVSPLPGAGGTTVGAVGPVAIEGNPGIYQAGVTATGGTAPDGGGAGGIGGKPGTAGGVPGGGGGGKNGNLGGDGGPGGAAKLEFSWGVTTYDYGRVVVAGAPRVARQPQIKRSGVMRNIREAYIVKSGVARTMFRAVEGEVDPEDPPPATVPSYVPDGHEAKYNPNTNCFNFNPGNTARLKASIQDAASARKQWMHFGDSVGDGFINMTTQKPLDAYILKVRDKLNSELGTPIGGTGLVRCRTIVTYADERWKKYNQNTTNALKWQNNLHYITNQNKIASYAIIFESDKPGTRVDIACLDRYGIEVTIDDGAPIVLPGTNTDAKMVHTISGLANTIHKVSILPAVHAQQIAIGAVDVYNTTGLEVHNVSQGGAKVDTAKLGQDVWSDITSPIANMLPFYQGLKPSVDALFIEMGGNDMKTPVNYAGIQAGFDRIIDAFPNSDKVMIMMLQGDPATFNGDFPRFWEETMQTCLDNDIPLIDTRAIMGSFDNMVANGWNGDQYGHLNIAGATYLGESIALGLIEELGL